MSRPAMTLSELTVNQIARLLNGRNNPQAAAISHLAAAAARAAESLVYLADLDDCRFRGIWPIDAYSNDTVDDAHVRWAATSALTSIDLCIACAARLGNFSNLKTGGEASVRNYYSVNRSGKVTDKRNLVPAPWRTWIDGAVNDPGYHKLLRVRHALVHADAIRHCYATTDSISGHSMRFGYYIGPLQPPVGTATHQHVSAREVVEVSRDTSSHHVRCFIATLATLP